VVQLGVLVFFLGMYINIKSDYMLFALRKNKTAEKRYSIPTGFLYNYISCPNYFGEILEWFGWAMATNFSPAAVAFVFFTFANLFPRALKTHEWYKSTFNTYPKSRRAIIPGLL
jgi:3-oxo-5-alpha-steroid 4-dehydrogenase 1